MARDGCKDYRDHPARNVRQETCYCRWTSSLRNSSGIPGRVPVTSGACRPRRTLRKSDDDAIQYDGEGADHSSNAPRSGQRGGAFIPGGPRSVGGGIRLAFISVRGRRRTSRGVREIPARLDGTRTGAKSDRRVRGGRSVLSLLAQEGGGPGGS